MNRIGLFTHIRKEVNRFMKVINQTLFPPIVSSLLFLLIFHFVVGGRNGTGDGTYLAFLLPGLIMMSIVNNAFANTSSSIFIAKWTKQFEHTLTMPLSYLELVIGYIVGGIIRSFMIGLGIILTTFFFIDIAIQHYFVFFFYFLLSSIIFGSFGILVGLWADHFEHIGIFNTFLLTPLTMLGGVFYSISVLPEMFQYLTLFNPVFYLVDGFRYSMLGISDSSLLLGMSVSLILAVGSFFLVVFLMKKGYKVKQ